MDALMGGVLFLAFVFNSFLLIDILLPDDDDKDDTK